MIRGEGGASGASFGKIQPIATLVYRGPSDKLSTAWSGHASISSVSLSAAAASLEPHLVTD